MRSTRGRLRSDTHADVGPHFTDAARITVPLTSNAPTHNPGNALAGIRNRGFGALPTMLQLSRGGFSSYYRSREGFGQ
jgi:hypothetical protein